MQRPGTEAIREPKPSAQIQNGKYIKLQIAKIQREHLANRVSSSFLKLFFSILILQGEIMGSKGNLILKVSKPDDDSPSMSIEIHKIYHDAQTDPPQQYFIFYND